MYSVGDSWQICLQQPSLALTAATLIRAGFKADEFDTRIGIGWGPVERINKVRISESSGQAFTWSGQALDELGKLRRIALAPSGESNAPFSHGLFDAGVGLLNALMSRWTRREATAVCGSLRKLPQDVHHPALRPLLWRFPALSWHHSLISCPPSLTN